MLPGRTNRQSSAGECGPLAGKHWAAPFRKGRSSRRSPSERSRQSLHRQLGALALSPFISQRLAMFFGMVRAADLAELTGLIEAGTVKPALERTFPLAEAATALRHLEEGKIRGKITIVV
ncbi:zinc-binding dehydrogenase [Crystallibacter crystallopoietes]|nr:zinc-binding dehydrogenase [Arthrobacter crystallopoietes]